jgi:isopenicillin N synthase-like dioxygenase
MPIFIRSQNNTKQMAASSSIGIPVVDLAQFQHPETKADFVRALGRAYEAVGFAAVTNHGIDHDLVERFYHQVKAFFGMQRQAKKRYEMEDLAGQRGYTSFGREHAKGSEAPDLKEFWQFGQPGDGEALDPAEYPDNIEVDELPEFNCIGMELFRNFERSGALLLQALALHLGLDEHYFDSKIHNGNSILRAIHYPPITEEPKSSIRSEQHEDINLITLLVGASADGLQVLNHQGEWIPVNTTPDMIVVNVGDMLQRLTNGRLKSTTHRVVNPPRDMWHTSRLSVPFFLHPRSEVPLNCLESCIDPQHPKQFEDITAGAYLRERLIEIGLLKA